MTTELHITSYCCLFVMETFINVTGPAKINHVSANYVKLYFANIVRSKCSIPIPYAAEESPLNSALGSEDFVAVV